MESPLRSLLNKRSLSSKRKQKGAVAIVLGLSLVTLFAMGGVVLDLGHLYIAKAELQNAADAAALAGARSLNETTAGVTDAIAKAQAIGAKNKYNFSTDVSLNNTTDIQFGSSPDGPWYNSTALANPPTGITFVKVDTGSKSLDTYLMRVVGPGFNTVSTSGVAVAGRFVVNVTPIGVCAIDPDNRTTEIAATNELVEFGFRRGLTYNIPALGPLGGAAGVPMYLNPVESAPTACVNSHSNVPFTKSFICNGNSAIGSGVSVYANTGGSYGPIEKAINSRFDEASSFGPSGCDVALAPPDSNVKDYAITPPPIPATPPPPLGKPDAWMNADPSNQGITIVAKKPQNFPSNPSTTADFGVLWSYSRAVRAAGTSPNFTAGAPFTPTDADWTTLYTATDGTHPTPTSYPVPAPYSQISGNFFEQPPIVAHRPGVANRRLMNLVIVDCRPITSAGGLSCAPLPVKGIGRFFLQTPADLTGNPRKMFSEFAGLIEPAPTSEIKLYR